MALNSLLSYAYHQGTDLAGYRAAKCCGRIMVDSGAFTAYTGGVEVDLVAYAEFLEQWRGSWDYAVTLDVIGDPAATARNTRILQSRGLDVMPVFTRGGTLAEFDAMVADHGYVCVGGLIGVHPTIQAKRVSMLQRRAREAGGGIHALGIASMTTMRAARPYSADASTFTQVAKYGAIVWFDGEHLQQATMAKRDKLIAHQAAIRAHGVDLAAWLRAGRFPTGPASVEIHTCMATGYAAADEHLAGRFDVPAPAGVADSGGTHLYVAVRNADALAYLIEADRRCHGVGDRTPPLIWRQHATRHRCAHTPEQEQTA